MYVDGQSPYRNPKPVQGDGYVYRRELVQVYNFLRLTVKDFIESPMVGTFILSTVLINIAMVVSQTYMTVMVRAGWFLSAMDAVFMAVYISEYIIKVFVWRKSFFKNFWNDLDLGIVCLTLLVFVVPLVQPAGTNRIIREFTVFRTLRIFKVAQAMQVFQFFKDNRFLMNIQTIFLTCIRSLKSMGAIIVLMLSYMAVFSIMFRELFAEADPSRFGNMLSTIYTLFQLFTMDDWSLVYRTSKEAGYWYIIIFLVLYIFIEHFIFFTLFIAVLVDNFHLIIAQQNEDRKQKEALSSKESDEAADSADKGGQDLKGERMDDEMSLMTVIEDHYSNYNHTPREKMLIFYCFQLMGAIEQQLYVLQTQNTILNETLDCLFETAAPSEARKQT